MTPVLKSGYYFDKSNQFSGMKKLRLSLQIRKDPKWNLGNVGRCLSQGFKTPAEQTNSGIRCFA